MSKLIDADKLLKIIENDIQMTQSWLDRCKSIGEKVSLTVQLNTIKSYQAIVEDMPTAYDVDKVVEQLEKEIKENPYQSEYLAGLYKAIEIVKAGEV